MEAEANNIKWEGKATAKLLKSTVADVWPLLEDFYSIHKWIPAINTCSKVEGADGKHGLVRHVTVSLPPPQDGGEPAVRWCHEKLTDIDAAGKWLSYEITENNMGIKSYKSTMKVMPIDGGDESGCQIEWSFVADPGEGLSCEDLTKFIELGLQGMANNIEYML